MAVNGVSPMGLMPIRFQVLTVAIAAAGKGCMVRTAS
jgi:hypothetical protein